MTLDMAARRHAAAERYDRTFYTGMAIAAAAVVFAGFAPTFFLRARYQSTALPLYLQIHGVLFTAWIGLFAAQAALVAMRRTDLHRTLGWAGAVLAIVMVVAGTRAGLQSMRGHFPAQGDAALSFLTTPLFSMAVFAALVATAIALRRRPATHKRLMLVATISLLDAAVARLPVALLQSSSWASLIATDLFLAAAVVYDLATRGRIHPAHVWGGLLLVRGQALRVPVGETEAWKTIARLLLGV